MLGPSGRYRASGCTSTATRRPLRLEAHLGSPGLRKLEDEIWPVVPSRLDPIEQLVEWRKVPAWSAETTGIGEEELRVAVLVVLTELAVVAPSSPDTAAGRRNERVCFRPEID